MKTNVKLLAEICEVAGAPGYEQRVRELVLKNIKNEVDAIETDNIGNIYAIKKRSLIYAGVGLTSLG